MGLLTLLMEIPSGLGSLREKEPLKNIKAVVYIWASAECKGLAVTFHYQKQFWCWQHSASGGRMGTLHRAETDGGVPDHPPPPLPHCHFTPQGGCKAQPPNPAGPFPAAGESSERCDLIQYHPSPDVQPGQPGCLPASQGAPAAQPRLPLPVSPPALPEAGGVMLPEASGQLRLCQMRHGECVPAVRWFVWQCSCWAVKLAFLAVILPFVLLEPSSAGFLAMVPKQGMAEAAPCCPRGSRGASKQFYASGRDEGSHLLGCKSVFPPRMLRVLQSPPPLPELHPGCAQPGRVCCLPPSVQCRIRSIRQIPYSKSIESQKILFDIYLCLHSWGKKHAHTNPF